MDQTTFRPSPFFNPGPVTRPNSLAILHLSRDQSIPTQLRGTLDDVGDGFHEEVVTNTRFGSFPHSTLLGLPWGSQVVASKVITGGKGKKRKRDDVEQEDDAAASKASNNATAPAAASSGFIHVLPPTPESWTISLPHRTQVVYTPDYSFILQRLQARPGSVIIEAGAGSGSFSHAAARAVFNGYPSQETNIPNGKKRRRTPYGKVYSFEFHEGRAKRFQQEIDEHGLGQIIELTHRDVCEHGFMITKPSEGVVESEPIPQANAVFLDLPAPWLALKHLTRPSPTAQTGESTRDAQVVPEDQRNSLKADSSSVEFGHPVSSAATSSSCSSKATSPLDPLKPVHLCTFSPCIEQVQRTVSTLRQLGWLEISMFELSHHRIDVRRERIGLQEEGLRGVNATPATVEEAVGRLKELEEQWGNRRSADALTEDGVRGDDGQKGYDGGGGGQEKDMGKAGKEDAGGGKSAPGRKKPRTSKQERLRQIKAAAATRKLYKEGRLVHRTEPELKTHTSYLVFAVLPRQWTSEDEEMCRRKWPVKAKEGTVEEA